MFPLFSAWGHPEGGVIKIKNLSEENAGKITFSMVFLVAVKKMPQNHYVLFVGRNLQTK